MSANKCYASLDFSFPMQILFTMMQMRNVHMMHMSLFRDAIFIMQVSHARVQMQNLSMMVPVHIFNRNANVFLQRWKCKNLVVQMPSNGYVLMQMLLVGISWCKCPPGAMMQMFWPRHQLFKNSLYFQNEASSALETKIFSRLDLSYFFDLRLPKKWWSLLENLQMRHWLEIRWSGLKRFISTIWLSNRGGLFPWFFWKNEFF